MNVKESINNGALLPNDFSNYLFVLTLGLTCLSHLYPGSSVTLAIVVFPKFTISIFSFSNVSVLSGDFRLFVICFLSH
jgi:hypothetical protein